MLSAEVEEGEEVEFGPLDATQDRQIYVRFSPSLTVSGCDRSELVEYPNYLFFMPCTIVLKLDCNWGPFVVHV